MNYDVIIIGAGASGLMCAIRAGERGLSCLILEKSEQAGKKILISGGGRCNFTNIYTEPSAYLSKNPFFCKSALSRYTPYHFIELLKKHQLHYHEKSLGQLFCDEKSPAILDMLLREADNNKVTIAYNQNIKQINYQDKSYLIQTEDRSYSARNLVIATGGPSIPKIGASSFALSVAKQFSIKKSSFEPALVPLTLKNPQIQSLSGVSIYATVSINDVSFSENILFTHRGLSGPAILQISSYWQKDKAIHINLLPDISDPNWLINLKNDQPKKQLITILSNHFPKKFSEVWIKQIRLLENKPLNQYNHKKLQLIQHQLQNWQIIPDGTEGLKKAEVSTGGISTDALSSKTLMSKQQKGLYFIGEAVDVTGWLGGYNFQWAWASGWCAGDLIN